MGFPEPDGEHDSDRNGSDIWLVEASLGVHVRENQFHFTSNTSCQRKGLFTVLDCSVKCNVGQSLCLSVSLSVSVSAGKSCCIVVIDLDLEY